MYYMRLGHCKFGNACSYLHSTPSDHTSESNDVKCLKADIVKLEEALERVLAALEAKENEMKAHEQRILALENLSQLHKCTHCDYEATSTTSLKSHISKKHKIETLREADDEQALQASFCSYERKESPDSPFISTSFKCKFCSRELTSSAHLNGHISMYHDTSIPHPSKWAPNACHICNKSFHQTGDFKNHMVKYHGFSEDPYGVVCSECDESSDLGRYYVVPGQLIFMECKLCLTDGEDQSPGGPGLLT
jgi:hypothetical protein